MRGSIDRIFLQNLVVLGRCLKTGYRHRPNRSLIHNYVTRNVKMSDLGTLRTMKLDTPEFHAIFTPELKLLISLYEKNSYHLRIAGGAVRDLLMGKTLHDVDFATTATPTQMTEMYELEGIRMFNMKGEGHGTITCRINDKENFEVTTLRIDIRTNGRHAEVEFTKDWQLDANRRDLTINAMFLDFDGTVYDYFNGVEDVKNQKVKFVGTAADRIQEDYLRILRYFRFFGRISDDPTRHEESCLRAIKENGDGLTVISGERIWSELRQIVTGSNAARILKTMTDVHITQYMGFPEHPCVDDFGTVCDNTEGLNPDPVTRLSGLLANGEQVYELHTRLKFSTDELKLAHFIVAFRDNDPGDEPVKFYQHLMAAVSGKDVKSHGRICELLKYKGYKDVLTEIQDWTVPNFPVSGQDLHEHKVKKGPVFSTVLNALRKQWIESDFQMTHEELVLNIDEIIVEHALDKRNAKP